tara:strand:+ start:11778 stop:15464 length:3687 start_codon:yes stop_codon:yes gene_type:complete
MEIRNQELSLSNSSIYKGKILIEASAGTGKTFAIAHIVLRLITESKISIEEILLLSFTNTTAAELRNKVLERIELAKLLITTDQIDNKIFDEELVNWYINFSNNKKKKRLILNTLIKQSEVADKSLITTFHGLSKYLYDTQSIFNNSIIGAEIIENSKSIAYDVVKEFWLNNFISLNPDIIHFIKNKTINKTNKIDIDFIVNLIIEIDDENIYSLDDTSKHIETTKEIKILIEEWTINYWNRFYDLWTKEGLNLYSLILEISKEMNENGIKSNKYRTNHIKNRYNITSQDIHKINQEFLDTGDYMNILNKLNKIRYLKDYFYICSINKELNKHNFKSKYNLTSNLQEAIENIIDGIHQNLIIYSVLTCKEKLSLMRKSKGEISYSELIQYIDRINKSKKDIRSIEYITLNNITEKISVTIIDEFQDTDEIQYRFLENIFTNKKDSTLILVGDPKQAIYNFRGGDIDTYNKVKSSCSKIYYLKNNYRSNSFLLDSINKIYSKGLPVSKIKSNKLTSKAKETKQRYYKNNFRFHIITNKEDNSSSDCLDLETQIPIYIKNSIIRLYNQNKNLKLSDICILVSTNHQANKVKKTLEEYMISSNIKNKENIFHSPGARMLQLILDCLSKNNKSTNVSKLIDSPLFIKPFSSEKPDTKKPHKYIINKIGIIRDKIEEDGLINGINKLLINQIQNNEIDLKIYNQLIYCAEILEQQLFSSNNSLEHINRWLRYQRTSESNNIEFPKNNSSNGELDSVNILTIHSSKGLEFKYVICPYLWKPPIYNKGPLWKDSKTKQYNILISQYTEKVLLLSNYNRKQINSEYERLCYVAITRAKEYLEIFSFNEIDNSYNPINQFLSRIDDNLINDIEEDGIICKEYQGIIIRNVHNNILIKKRRRIHTNKLSKEPNFGNLNILYKNLWKRSSYSYWISNKTNDHLELLEIKDQNYLNNKDNNFNKLIDKEDELKLNIPNPLADFPKGRIPGICLHKILENYNYNDNINLKKKLIRKHLETHQIKLDYVNQIIEALEVLYNTEIGGTLNNTKLTDIPYENFLSEVEFDIPISKRQGGLNSNLIAKAFEEELNNEINFDYSSKLRNLSFTNYGFHCGSIDKIFYDQSNYHDSKWWIIDWKSNYISNKNNDCIPVNYLDNNLKEEMNNNHYILQANLYLLALHRFLEWRLVNYDPYKNLGGYIYFFIRGITSHKMNNLHTPGIFIRDANINRIKYLDKLFKNER